MFPFVYYRGGPAVLRDLNLSFGAEGKIGIAGRTGAGHYEWFACHFRQFYIKLKLKVRSDFSAKLLLILSNLEKNEVGIFPNMRSKWLY